MENVLEKVIALVKKAGIIAAEHANLKIKSKGNQDFVTHIDIAISDFLMKELPKLIQGSSVISEEEKENQNFTNEYIWVIDPIDGTSNLIFDMQLSAVSVGLLHKMNPVLGVVYNPFTDELFSAEKGKGVFLNDKAIQVNTFETLSQSLVLFETNPYGDRTTKDTIKIIDRIFQNCVDYRVTGSAALDICYVAAGRASAFMAQMLFPWDMAGGAAILAEAGGTICQWDGNPINYIEPQTCLATNKRVEKEAIKCIQEAGV